jgi:hypothetical protein
MRIRTVRHRGLKRFIENDDDSAVWFGVNWCSVSFGSGFACSYITGTKILAGLLQEFYIADLYYPMQHYSQASWLA